MEPDNQRAPLEITDILELHMDDGSEMRFEVVGLVEDDDDHVYAISYNEHDDEFIVTNQYGDMLDDDALAQEVLDDFFVLAQEHQSE